MTHKESNETIILVGGSKHGETVRIPKTINFNRIDFGNIDGEIIYTVCQSGDGRFYGVFNPSDRDPSVARINALRAMIGEAIE